MIQNSSGEYSTAAVSPISFIRLCCNYYETGHDRDCPGWICGGRQLACSDRNGNTRTRSLTSAALASSVWLVCRKRSTAARPGWDNNVLEEMRTKIGVKLREFWDAGIRGPDFVWAATGPAMEAYSKHPVVRKANEPNATMGVTEFLTHVRRMVVDYVVGQVLTGERAAKGTWPPPIGSTR